MCYNFFVMCQVALKLWKQGLRLLFCPMKAYKAWRWETRAEFNNNYKDRLLPGSWLFNRLVKSFFWLSCCMLGWKIHVLFKVCKGHHWWNENRYHIVDGYVVAWSILITILFLFLCPFPNSWFIWLFIIFGACRLFDIFLAWVNTNILTIDPRPYSAPRMFVLNILSFSQVIVVYAGFALLASNSFLPARSCEPIKSIWDGFYYSFTTITTMDSGFSPKDWIGYLLFYSEVSFGILFLIVVIQQVLSLYRQQSK